MSDGQDTATPLVLKVENVSKSFSGVPALIDVSIDLQKGEILGLLGENGAGKSTLLKILAGAQPQDRGEILLRGAPYAPSSPEAAIHMGLVTIYQELSLILTLSVAENVFIGRAPVGHLGLIDWREMYDRTREIIARVGLSINPATPVSELSVAEQQLVEIARALSLNTEIIIMDEPTSALTETEVARLLSIMKQLRDEGVAIMFVTHRLEEASAVCDRVTVLRDGRLSGNLVRDQSPIPVSAMIEKMVGRAAEDLYARPKQRGIPGDAVLSARGVTTRASSSHAVALRGVDLDVRAGEILGVAGLVGSGRTEFARVVFGADPLLEGELTLNGRSYRPRTPVEAIASGIGLVPENRKQQAIFPILGIGINLTIASLRQFSSIVGWMNEGRERLELELHRKALSIRMASPHQPIVGLSGGNQQKVILARWLARSPQLLIVDEPTRGVDVGAKAEVHHILVDLAARGVAILMISSELPEILAVSDRIATMCRGRITATLPAEGATEDELMRLMTLEAA